MTQISTRIIWKKGISGNKGQIDLLCHHYGKKTNKLSNPIVLKKLYLYIQKKRTMKKQIITQEENKSVLNSFTKNLYAVMNRKK